MALSLPQAPGDGPILVAFSGSLGSSVLLQLAAADARLRERVLRALHVDHRLHADPAQWAEHCRQQCDSIGVAFVASRVSVRPDGDGLAAAARAGEESGQPPTENQRTENQDREPREPREPHENQDSHNSDESYKF